MPVSPRILSFADAGRTVGFGHVFRVAPVVAAMNAMRFDAQMFSPMPPSEPDESAPMLKATSRQFTRIVAKQSPAVVLLDSYRDMDRLCGVVPAQSLAIFDDRCTPACSPRILINASPSATPARYRRHRASALLLGPRYSSLHASFRAARAAFRVRKDVRRILVALGGGDTEGNLPLVVASIRRAAPTATLVVCGAPGVKIAADEHIERMPWLTQSGIASEFARCDLAVLAGGQMLVQAACIGVPAISFPQTENQSKHAQAWQRIGSARVVRKLARLPAALRTLQGDAVRRAMSAAGRKTVDGLGAIRIARSIANVARP